MALLAFAFAGGWTISTAMAAHLPHLLQLLGSTKSEAIAAGMLVGPAQVAARFVEAGLLRRAHPLLWAERPRFCIQPARHSCWRRRLFSRFLQCFTAQATAS